MPHPFSLPGNKSGAYGMAAGDRVVYILDGRHGIVDEFLQDGDAYVSFDDGCCMEVKWHYLILE